MASLPIDLHRRTWVLSIVAGALLLFSGLFLLGPGGRDDVYKTLWPAEALADTGHIINYNGDPIEQSSSLLHVLLLAGLRTCIGGPIVDLNLAMVLFFGVVGIFLAMQVAQRMEIAPHWSQAIALGAQGIYAYWAMAGLDAVLAADCWLFFVWALAAWLEGGGMKSLPLAAILLVLVRPENGLLACGAMGMAFMLHLVRQPKLVLQAWGKRLLVAIMLVVGMAAMLAIWRLWHGGHWLPQSALAKMGGLGYDRGRRGLRYLWYESLHHPELFFYWISLLTLAWRHLRRGLGGLGLLVFCISVIGMLFVVMTGGDWMENARFVVPFVPLLVMDLFAEFQRLPDPWGKKIAVGFALLCCISLCNVSVKYNTGYSPFLGPNNSTFPDKMHPPPYAEAYNRVHLRDIYPKDFLISEHDRIFAAKGQKVEILSQQAGFMAYYLAMARFGQFHFVDLVGLCTPDFTDCHVTKDRGRLPGGLNMDLVYLIGNFEAISAECAIPKPDIIFGLDEDDRRLEKFLVEHGYVSVMSQGGHTAPGFLQYFGMQISANEFIVVLDRWGAPAKTGWRWIQD